MRLVRAFIACLLLGAAGPAPAAEVTVAVISDLNGSYGSGEYGPAVAAAVERIRALAPDLVISTGDMVAGQRPQPRLRPAELDELWSGFRAAVATPLEQAGIALAVTPGNHDASGYPGFEDERLAYRRAWAGREPPGLLDGGDFPFHYAFSLGDALFVAIDATRSGPLEPRQLAWLEGTLARHGPRYRWRVVYGHLPIRGVNRMRMPESLDDPALESLLVEHRVDVYLSGHHHAFYPAMHAGLAQVSQGCLGASPRPLVGADSASPRTVTVLVFGPDDQWRVGALAGPAFTTWLDVAGLPELIPTPGGVLERLDRAAGPGRIIGAAAGDAR